MDSPQFPDLRAFIRHLEQTGDLAVVEAEVDPRLEVGEIHRRVIAAGGPALLFANVRGSDHRLVTNLFGTRRRAALAFSERPGMFVRELVETVETIFPPSINKIWAARSLFARSTRIGRRQTAAGPVTDVVTSDVRLDRLPALTCWSEDGGPFLTWPLVYTTDPHTGQSNLGVYRMQIHDHETTGMHWQIGKGGGFHHHRAESGNRPLPVTVFLGGPPALTLAAVAPLPENVPEVMLASLIAGRRLRSCRGPGEHPLFADAEFALIGEVPPGERKAEGPFGDHYGYYSMRHDYPVFRVSHVARRHDAILPATVVGKPRQEDLYIGDMLQEILHPLFPLVMPGVDDLWAYGETGYHSLAAAVVKERYRREAIVSAFRILGEGQLSLTKFLLLTDSRVNLRNFRRTLEHVLERTRPETDLYVISNLSMDSLDYTGPQINRGSKGLWLGTGEPVRKLPAEFNPAVEPPRETSDVRVYCPGCLVVSGTGDPSMLAAHPAFEEWMLVVLVDDAARTVASDMNFLWTVFTRFEPAADVYSSGHELVRNHVSYRSPILIDARLKPGFPDELFCDPETAELVTKRWTEYFPQGMEMGDSDLADLDKA